MLRRARSPARIALVLVIGLLGMPSAQSHHGFESEIQVRLLGNQTFVIVRMTVSVAAALLGAGAPVAWSDAVVQTEQERLGALGAGLMAISPGASALKPASVKVSLEVSGQVAFVILYPPVQTWPLTIEAAYFRAFGPEFTGTMRVFGPPRQPTERFGPEVAAVDLIAERRSLEIPKNPAPQP